MCRAVSVSPGRAAYAGNTLCGRAALRGCSRHQPFQKARNVCSSNYTGDLRHKVAAYAEARIPVYAIVDRKHSRVHVLTEPLAGGYDRHEVYAPGQEAPLPDSIGAEVVLDVAELINAGRAKSSPSGD